MSPIHVVTPTIDLVTIWPAGYAITFYPDGSFDAQLSIKLQANDPLADVLGDLLCSQNPTRVEVHTPRGIYSLPGSIHCLDMCAGGTPEQEAFLKLADAQLVVSAQVLGHGAQFRELDR
jgi:hypothetical protein